MKTIVSLHRCAIVVFVFHMVMVMFSSIAAIGSFSPRFSHTAPQLFTLFRVLSFPGLPVEDFELGPVQVWAKRPPEMLPAGL